MVAGQLSTPVPGVAGDIGRGWSIQQFATSADVTSNESGTGSASVTLPANSKTRFLSGKEVTVTHGQNSFTGHVDSIARLGSGGVGLGVSSLMSVTNVEVTAPPIGDTQASEVLRLYLGLVTDRLSIDWQSSTNPLMSIRGWRGNLWYNLREFASSLRMQLTIQGSTVIVRALDESPVLNIQDAKDVEYSIKGDDTARELDVWYDNPVYVPSVTTLARNLDTNPSVEVNSTGWGAGMVVGGGIAVAGNRTNVTAAVGSFSWSISINNTVDQGGTRGRTSARADKLVTIPESDIPVGSSVYVGHSARIGGGNNQASTPGSTYSSIRRHWVWLEWISPTGTVLAQASSPPRRGSNTGFVTVTLALKRPVGADRLRVLMYGDRTDVITPVPAWNAHNYYWDALIIGTRSATYFDGSTPGGVWDGTPGNSSSSMVISGIPAIYDAARDGNRILSVNVGERILETVESDAYAQTILKPSQTDSVNPGVGQYFVSDRNDVPVKTSQWYAYGGDVEVAIGEEPGTLDITLVGPTQTIPGVEGPFSLSVTRDGNEYAALSILGTGVFTSPSYVTLLTAADPSRTTAVKAPEIRNPFISSASQAYNVGSWPAAIAGDGRMVLSFSLPTSESIRLGVTEGSIVRYADVTWHVTEVGYGRGGCTFSAEWFTTMGEFDEPWIGRPIQDFDDLWSGLTAGDVQIAPMRKV